jgi:hypothetical protein
MYGQLGIKRFFKRCKSPKSASNFHEFGVMNFTLKNNQK